MEPQVMEKFSKALDSLIVQFAPELIKAKGKAEDGEEKKEEKEMEEKGKKMSGKGKAESVDEAMEDEKKKEKEAEEEKKAKGKGEDAEDDYSKGKGDMEEKKEKEEEEKGYKSLTAREQELIRKGLAAEKAEKKAKEESELKFKKSVVESLVDLKTELSRISKSPARVRKSAVTDFEVIEKGKQDGEKELEVTRGEMFDVITEMVEKGEIGAGHGCEFNGSGTISDPMVKSKVIAKILEKKKGLRG